VQGAAISIKSASCANCSTPSGEGPSKITSENGKLVDMNFQSNKHTKIEIELYSPAAIASYNFKTGNDNALRDPTAWTIYNADGGIVDQRSNQQFTSSRKQSTSKIVLFDKNSLNHKQCVLFLGSSNNKPDWVATCYQNRTTFLTADNLPNCLVTADFGTKKECYKCAAG